MPSRRQNSDCKKSSMRKTKGHFTYLKVLFIKHQLHLVKAGSISSQKDFFLINASVRISSLVISGVDRLRSEKCKMNLHKLITLPDL